MNSSLNVEEPKKANSISLGKVRSLLSSLLVQNIGALAIVQAMGYLVPLLTLPYLTRVLGPEEWGRVAWMQVILGYFSVFTDWGFSWSGTRKTAALRHNHEALSKCFIAGWTVQWLLCVIAVSVLLFLGYKFSFFASFRSYVFFGAGMIVSGVLFPVWLLSGLERMRDVAIIQLFIRSCALPLIFLFVQNPGDGKFVILSAALTGVIGGIASIVWIWKNSLLHWHWPSWANVWAEFLESGTIFFSRLWIVLYTSLVPSILGVMLGAESVGQFVLADRVRIAVQSLLSPISQALFPRMSYLYEHNKVEAVNLLRRSGLVIIATSLTVSFILFVLAKPIILFFAGGGFQEAIILLRWLSPLPFIVALSNIIGVQIMLPNMMTQAFNRILAGAGVISFIFLWCLINEFGAKGAAINMLVAECYVTFSMILCVWNKKRDLYAY